MSWRHLAYGAVLVLPLACGSDRDRSEPGEAPAPVAAEPSPAPEPVPAPAVQVTPEREAAAEVLRRFSDNFLAGNEEAALQDLRVPEGIDDKQLRYFLAELSRGEHISAEGVALILEKDFGPIAERFGEHAESVADNADLEVEEAYAFGDAEAAAVLHWDGERFRVAAVHHLGETK